MAQAKVVEQVAAPIEKVWSEIGNFSGIKPGAGIESVDYEGEGVGMTRSIRLANGTIVEQLNEHDAAAKTFGYAIINEDCPLPFADYSASVELKDNGDNTTTVEWIGTFEPKGVDEKQAVNLASTIYTNAIKGARMALGV